MNTKPDDISREDIDTRIDWQTLDSQADAVLDKTQAALEEALAATRKLGQWMERLHTQSGFMRRVESGLAEVRHQLKDSPRAHRSAFDWETLDSQADAGLEETHAALEEALAATRKLGQWVERLHTLSAFMGQVESGLVEVRHQLKEPSQAGRPAPIPSMTSKADTVEVSEPWPLESAEAEPEAGEEHLLTALEAQEAESKAEASEVPVVAWEPPRPAVAVAWEPPGPAVAVAEEPPGPAVAVAEEPPRPAEGEPLGTAPLAAEVNNSIRLQIESPEANIDLMVVERALRETPGVADVDLLDYAGKRARVLVTFKGGERPKEVADPERLAANVQERLAKLTWDGSLSVSATE